ncbi:class I SAM-dependent methyltransferase [Nocardia stercoris]|uniref:S-adenosyl-L-methionine-dependent methyltransferase n=1 Tax=Nocardia stercoris TaxID=2483361 RepID=A0A3M2KZP5_9NOCA|nr:class I SAM-dependent methyltransferase [Nocardia stercoris]RMI29930.1 SAM-dependent methyltransferase [Nocardia stercoris]
MREDGDSWDVTESVGMTAVGVAAMRAAETARPDALFQDPYAEKLVAAVGSGWAKLMSGEVTVDDADQARMYGMASFMTARTVYFDEYFAATSAAGIRQVVILAAGLDARAYRLEWPSGTVVYELDQPKVLAFKAAALADDEPAADLREIAVDLREDWPKALRDKGFDPVNPTAWLAEGLLRYLPADAQDRLLADIDALSAPGSRVAINTWSGVRAENSELRAAREEMLAKAGLTIDVENLWYDEDDRTPPVAWFAAHGWQVETTDSRTLLAAHGREVPDIADTELLRHTLMTATRP